MPDLRAWLHVSCHGTRRPAPWKSHSLTGRTCIGHTILQPMQSQLSLEKKVDLQETLIYSLSNQGYDVQAVGYGKTALDAARRYCPNLLLLDLMLPVLDGFDDCRILRREMSVPILMLAARNGEIDRVLGLEMGADD